MKVSFDRIWSALQLVILLVVVLAALAPISPLYEPVPARDQGVYLYAGQQVLDGKIPYRDVWDHKGPLIYYINALGLRMLHSIWGVWLLEVVFLFGAAFASVYTLRFVFDPLTAFLSTLLWLAAFSRIVDHGNSVEEYSLLFQFMAVCFYLRGLRTGKPIWNGWLVGMTAALAFSLRPNNIGIHLAIGLVLFLSLFFTKDRSCALRQLAAMVGGSVIILFLIAIYFAAHRALGDLFDQVFVFNYYYTRLGEFSWRAIGKGFEILTFLVLVGLAGLIGAFLLRIWKRRDVVKDFFFFVLAAIPIQLVLSLLSGRKYMHYYIAWLPVLAFLAAFFIYSIQWFVRKYFSASYARMFILLVTGGLLLGFGLRPVFGRLPILINLFETIWTQGALPPPNYSAVEEGIYIDYILEHTRPDEYVLIWGNASVYNFLSDRESPSRFVYTYAFGVPPYISQAMADELQQNIMEKHPLILDATAGDATIDRLNSKQWKYLPVTEGMLRFIEANYVRIDTVGRFQVWIFKDN